MPLRVRDFVEEDENLTVGDLPPTVRDRLNDALEDLTGGPVGPPPDAILVSKNLDGRDGFNSISAAINDSETQPGDTIFVESGTYDENLAIGSPDAGTDPGSAPKADLRIVGQDRPIVDGFVQILDPGITFEGFEVTGEYDGYGVAVFEPNVTVRDVVVSGVTNGIFLPRKQNVRVEQCRVEHYSFYGMLVSGRTYSAEATPTVVDSVFNGASGGGAVGIGTIATPAEIRGNRVTEHEYTGNDGSGIAHFSGTGVTIQENRIENNDDGLFFDGPDAGTVTATRNDVVDNRVGVANEGPQTVTATETWWGDAGGPGAGTNDTATEGPVDTEPWSTEPSPDWNDDGTSGTGTSSIAASDDPGSEATGPSAPTDPARSS